MKKFFLITLFVLSCGLATAGQISVLSQKDADLYRQIFALQNKEDWKSADQKISKLKDKSLMGYILSQRYFSRTWITSKKEIEAWFQKYADHPQALRMYQLGEKKKAKLPKQAPKPLYGGSVGTCSTIYRPEPINSIENASFTYLSGAKKKNAQKTMNQIVNYIKNGKTLSAKRLLQKSETKKLFSAIDYDAACITLAFSYFLDGMDDKAFDIAKTAVKRSGNELPLGHWTLGLSAWRQGKTKLALSYFDNIVQNPKATAFLRSAAAYWASRANLKLGHFDKVNSYLETAAENSRSFYGILATRALGRDLNHTWAKPVLPEDEVTESFSHPTFERVLALKQLGFEKQANQELETLFLKADQQTRALLMAVAEKNGIASNLNAIAGELDSEDKVRYPAPNWTPEKGWAVDKALVFAFVKQESCFNANAKSSVGAQGLMQLMPDSARQIANNLKLDWDKKKLNEPEYNLALGQHYLLWLMNDKQIQNNLIFTAVAYNSGPGNLYKLKTRMKYNDDPLLFIESIPFKETRGFVERIMSNYWIYQTLMNQEVLSLDNLIEGCWPLYVTQDSDIQCNPPVATN